MTKLEFTFNTENRYSQPICPVKDTVHFIGVGGIGMSGLAKVLLEFGYKVSGSDIKTNKIVESLQKLGGQMHIGHSSENIEGKTLIVVSSAIKTTNPEIIEAKKQNIPIIHRAQLLEVINSGLGSKNKKISIGATGTHGKTTTSGMLAFVFEKLGLNPSFVVGGQLPEYNINSKAGNGEHFIAELDESDGSIELYSPDISIISNLELDHVDHYKNGFAQIIETFERYTENLAPDAKIILNQDDKGNLELLNKIKNKNILTYSSNSEDSKHHSADYRAEILETVPNAEFKVYKGSLLLGKITLGVSGLHNISNALSVIAVLTESEIAFDKISSSLKEFTGMKRRFQTIGYAQGAKIIDDYAHHPTEIKTTLNTAKKITTFLKKGEVIAVFQPHRYTRLKNLWAEFASAFQSADKVYLCDVFPAGEEPIANVNSQILSQELLGAESSYVSGDLDQVAAVLSQEIKEDDIVLTMGAGSITQLGLKIIEQSR